MLPVLLLLAAFLLMVTALTYQFQGWLAALMSNPRRRRTVIMVMTVIFVLIVQAAAYSLRCARGRPPYEPDNGYHRGDEEAGSRFESGEIDIAERMRRRTGGHGQAEGRGPAV